MYMGKYLYSNIYMAETRKDLELISMYTYAWLSLLVENKEIISTYVSS